MPETVLERISLAAEGNPCSSNPTRPPQITRSDLAAKTKSLSGQAIDLVSPDGQPNLPPGQIDVGVVPMLLSEVPDPNGEIERFAEVLEAKLLLDVVIIHNPPVVAQSGQ
jgi:hypothetical protein